MTRTVSFWCAGACGLALLVPATSLAAYPGSNGRIAYESNVGGTDKEIVMGAPDGSTATQLTTNTVDDRDPAWSPDGTRIAFARLNAGTSHFEIWTMNANGSSQAALATDAARDYTQPTWSPDGSRIAFQYQSSAGNDDIYRVDTSGVNVNLTAVANSALNERHPAWSPAAGASVIVFSKFNSTSSHYELVTKNLNTAVQATLLADADHDLTFPSWSPDASKIAYTYKFSATDDDIWETDGDGSDPAPLVFSGANERNVEWAPEGNALVLDTQSGTDFELQQANPDSFQQGGMAARPTTVDTNPDWQPVTTAQARPLGATPMYLPLTVAFNQCTAANATHEAPLAFAACVPPRPSSPDLTVGEPLVNGKAPNFSGFVRFRALAADTEITASLTDVRCARPLIGGYCAGGGGALADYAGDLQLAYEFRLTDRNYSASRAGTMVEVPVTATVPCTINGDPATGSTCSLSTTLNSIVGGSAVLAGQRSSFELSNVEIQGPPPGYEAFARPGIFQP